MTMRWMLALLAVIGGFFLAGIAGGIVSNVLLDVWSLPGAGFSAAFAVVVVTYLVAPGHKLISASIAFMIGAIIAYVMLEPSFLPESYGDRGAYEPTHLPVIATYLGGVVGLMIVAVLERWSHSHKIS